MKTTQELLRDSYEYAASPFASLLRFDDAAAVVTGGAQGIGRGIAGRLAELGAAVTLVDIDPAVTATAAELAGRHGADVTARVLDVRDSAALAELAGTVLTTGVRRLIWVNAAGIYPSHPLHELTDAEWDRVVGLDLTATFYGSRAAGLAVRAAGLEGVIVNISSVAGFRVGRPPGLAHYASAKHGVQGLTKALAVELGPYGVRAVAVAPGAVVTEGLVARFGDLDLENGTDYFSTRAQDMPIRRPSLPDDVARAVCFLASRAAANITGVILPVDAGHLVL
ncbi:3-oxoacyl-ACP reductase [Actinomadura sp. NBRC 104412]|uniref:SDR family NAD(P)-dependent oxidoreductase n=1 Tax=Actinomadura sp. NBRC 104412 TaxID=3032203 RepID=UPI0024A07101|nr:SDR family oxidoreductase [Actinomadura sp. NBRC 104412]GLZ07547.1 3-oxoacyl-ACP reductase [Actinomadura sp. NBRC 104412]